jgi:hypothetical protein
MGFRRASTGVIGVFPLVGQSPGYTLLTGRPTCSPAAASRETLRRLITVCRAAARSVTAGQEGHRAAFFPGNFL